MNRSKELMTLSSSTPLTPVILPYSPSGLKSYSEGRKKCMPDIPSILVSLHHLSNLVCKDLTKSSPGPAESDNSCIAETY